MNEDLLSNVSVENLDKLVDALVDVMKDMKEAEQQEEKRYSTAEYVRRIKKQG